MAAIPTYLYFGDFMISGGPLPETGLPVLWGQFLNNWKFSRAVPSGPDGWSPPALGNFEPYWDGAANGGAGAFVRYHYVSGIVVPGAKGDNWYGAGGGITSCTLLMSALWRRHPNGFKMLKFGVDDAGFGRWKIGGDAWNASRVEWDKMVAAVAPDTLDVQACVIDCSATDIVAESPTYLGDAREFVKGFRATYGALAQVVVVSHRGDFYVPNPGAARAARQLHQILSRDNARVSVFDMSFAEFGADGQTGGTVLGPNRTTYEAVDYVDAGARLGQHIDLQLNGVEVGAGRGTGIATYVLLGDSNLIAPFMDPAILLKGGFEGLLGPGGKTQRVGEWIWDAQNKIVVPYDITGVTNSLGSVDNVFGPEVTFLVHVHRHAGGDVVVFKYAQGGAALTSELFDGVWDVIRDSWAEFCAAVVRDLGRVVDCRGAMVVLGRNDGMVDAAASGFKARAEQFVDEVRAAFTTRTSGSPLPVVWVQPSPHASVVPGGSTVGSAMGLASVRNTVAALPGRRDRVGVVFDPGQTFPLLGDGLHYAVPAVLAVGTAAAESLRRIELGITTDPGARP